LEYFTPVEEICPSFFEYPSLPVLFNHIRFIYSNKITIENLIDIPLPEYVCYDEKFCGKIYPIEIVYNNLTCLHFNQFQLNENKSFSSLEMLIEAMKIPFLKCLPIFNEVHYCNHSTMYQCYNSTKCISKYKLLDSYSDCPFNDDETYNQSCLLDNTNYRFRCLVNDNEKCFAPLAIRNGHNDCDSGDDENSLNSLSIYPNNIFFGFICNGHVDSLSVLMDGKFITDESECEYWSCNNTYTQSNGFWSCQNGADELHCSPSDFPLFHYRCIFPNDTSKVYLVYH
jgi:hypothetical protein